MTPETETFGTRLRQLRLANGLTIDTAATNASVHVNSWRGWERGTVTPKIWRAPMIAAAIGVPVAQLFTDDVVLAELRLSTETCAQVRSGGRGAEKAVAERIASSLEPLIWQAATRPAVDAKPGARPKPRRSRVEKLSGVAQATAMRQAALERRRQASLEAADGP